MRPRGRRHLLLLDHDGLGVWRDDHGRLAAIARFPADGDGVLRFAGWLAAQPGRSRYTLLVDLADESYEVEVLPRSRGADRRALLQRRLDHHFYDAPYTSALSLGLTPETPPREAVLLAALPRVEPLAPWVEALAAGRALLTGIHGTALALDRLVRRLARRHPQLRGDFLLASTTSAGMRHSYFHRGRLRFSRLLGVAETEPLQRSRAHLHARGLIDRDSPLAVIVLGDANTDAPIDGRPHYSTLALPPAADEHTPQLLPALFRLLARGERDSDYAPADLRQPIRLQRHGHRILAGGLVASALCGALAIPLWLDNRARQADLHQLQAQAARQAADYRTLHDSLPALPAPPAELRALLEALAQQHSRHVDPRPLLAVLANSLDAHPDIVLHRLSWRRANGTAANGLGPLLLDIDAEALPPTAAHGGPSTATLERFLGDLGKHDGVSVHTPATIAPASWPGLPPSAGSSLRIRLELQPLDSNGAPW